MQINLRNLVKLQKFVKIRENPRNPENPLKSVRMYKTSRVANLGEKESPKKKHQWRQNIVVCTWDRVYFLPSTLASLSVHVPHLCRSTETRAKKKQQHSRWIIVESNQISRLFEWHCRLFWRVGRRAVGAGTGRLRHKMLLVLQSGSLFTMFKMRKYNCRFCYCIYYVYFVIVAMAKNKNKNKKKWTARTESNPLSCGAMRTLLQMLCGECAHLKQNRITTAAAAATTTTRTAMHPENSACYVGWGQCNHIANIFWFTMNRRTDNRELRENYQQRT